MTISVRDALLIGAVLLVVVFFGLWRSASAKADLAEAKHQTAAQTARSNAERLREVVAAHNDLVLALASERAAARAAGDRVDALRTQLDARGAENAALRAQLKEDRPDVQDYYHQPVPRPAVDLLQRAFATDRDG